MNHGKLVTDTCLKQQLTFASNQALLLLTSSNLKLFGYHKFFVEITMMTMTVRFVQWHLKNVYIKSTMKFRPLLTRVYICDRR